MEISGRIIQILPIQKGTNKNGNEWRKLEFVIETEAQYPKKVIIMLWGDKIDQFSLAEGQKITASVDLESREYNGRWYTEVRAWKIVKTEDGADSAPDDYYPPQQPEGDMPF